MSRRHVGWMVTGVVAVVLAAMLSYLALRPDSYLTSIGPVYGQVASPQLKVTWGDCLAGDPLEVEESADKIVITATVRLPPSAACPAIARIDAVSLAAPLGNREVVDASSGRSVDVLDPAEGP